jgi:hypothetical protein
LKSIEDCLNFYNTEKKYTDVNKFINFPDLLISELNYAIEHDTVFQYKNFIKKFIPSFLKPNAKFPIQLDFWINRGYSLNDAHSKISNIQSNFSKKFVEKRKSNPTQYLGISPNQIEYWTARGLSIDDAKLEVSNRQKTFSLSKCIQKYGKVQGLEKFNERQKKWQNSLNVSKDITWKTSQRRLSFAQYEKRYGKMWISVYVEHLNNKSKNIKYIVAGLSYKIKTMTERTKLVFEMINLDDDYIVDPNSIFINGWLPNWQMLDEFLFKKEDSNLPELIDNMESGKMYQVELEIWVDSDDYRDWIDFKVLDSGLV